MESWLESGQSVVLEHMEQCGFSGIVKTKEKQTTALVSETWEE